MSQQAIATLFEHEKDPINLIKIKELLEFLERATDKAEDVANVLETVVSEKHMKLNNSPKQETW